MNHTLKRKRADVRKLSFRVWRQHAGHTCGYCAMAALYRFHHLSSEVPDLRFRLGTDVPALGRLGTLPHDLMRVLWEDGFTTDVHRGSWHDVKSTVTDLIEQKCPPIALAHMHGDLHWIIITGVDAKHVVIADSAAGHLLKMTHADYEDCHQSLITAEPGDDDDEPRELTYIQLVRIWAKASLVLPRLGTLLAA